ncbi:hypothetical protein SAMN04515667_1890 [Formosa sp. Hel1_31_208]|uniref:hypothetical protein n=1 Tax=Formosa sp. Hel1_31_208 TaxID=1798225 RepID=UPI00087DC943|nr:hypothetical protein [Formosa sp. Hel1_31_208]SDS31278.1 hypothetical protein SAMN04515667_1890 [Formosa sp. Hel1_31_208]
MKRKDQIINFAVTICIALILSQFLPWWSVMVAGFVSSLFFSLKNFAVFLVPFSAIFVFWTLYAYIGASQNDFTLSRKIANLLPLGGSEYTLITVTGLIGGLAAGVAALLGKQCSLLVNKS